MYAGLCARASLCRTLTGRAPKTAGAAEAEGWQPFVLDGNQAKLAHGARVCAKV